MLINIIIFTAAIIFCFIYSIVYKRSINKKIATLFDAIENNDYQFRFRTKNLKSNHHILNKSLNRIKQLVLQARDRAKENERFFEEVLNEIENGIIITLPNGSVKHINNAALNIFSLNTLPQINNLNNISQNLGNKIINLKNGESIYHKFFNESSQVEIKINATEITINSQTLKIISIIDIKSDIDGAEIDSWKKMSRVFTHEIMNSLAPITSISQSLASSSDTQYIKQGAEIINTTSSRLINFVESYRTLTKIPPPNLEEIDLEELIKNTIKLYNANIDLNIKEGNYNILADKNQLTQVIVNLIKNASEAIEDNKSYKIWINLAHNNKGETFIEICNNGPEIPNEIIDNIFIPFFTTKENGTGIGLSLSRQIIRQHNAQLIVINKPHTTFKIIFS